MKVRLRPIVVASMFAASASNVAAQAQAPPADSPRAVMENYLEGLKALDQDRMNRYYADTVTSRSLTGDESPVDRQAMRSMRDFERAVTTSWTYRIVAVSGDRVSVELTEANEFYDLLGVGTRTQAVDYFVRDGRIYRMETTGRKHVSGDFTSAYKDFKRWLSTTAAARDPKIMEGGGIVFDRHSAALLRPWLERWAAERKRKELSGSGLSALTTN
jgi:hypothetical protein